MDARAILAWFDIFDWPLTPAEYAAYGVNIPTGTKIIDGFVVLPGREELAWLRRRKATWAWRKFKKARRWARLLALVPFVRLIAIGNDLGYGNCRADSDIDLVVVTAPRRVWLARFFIVGLLRLFGQRPGERARDALCPSFFFTTEVMNLEPLQIIQSDRSQPSTLNPQLPPDPYLLFWITQLTVLYDRDNIYDAFWRANEDWVQRWLPQAQPHGVHPRIARRSHSFRLPASSLWLDALERWIRRLQKRYFTPEVRALANLDSRVIINDRMIKLHTNDRRAEHHERWMSRILALPCA